MTAQPVRLRELRAQVSDEDTAKDREIQSILSDHRSALIREEEKGYERGLHDGRALADDLTQEPKTGHQ